MKLAGLTAAFALAAFGSEASATVVTTTFQGTVSSGQDNLGIFGAPGSDLTGDPFTAIFSINDSIPHEGFVSPSETEIFGGASHGFVTSPLSAVLTINGMPFAIAGTYSGEDFQCFSGCGPNGVSDGLTDNFFNGEVGPLNSLGLSVLSSTNQVVSTGDYHSPFSYVVQPGDNDTGQFTIEELSIFGPPENLVVANLDVTSVSTAGVPEPATWGLMLVGFGALGGLLRASRSQRYTKPTGR